MRVKINTNSPPIVLAIIHFLSRIKWLRKMNFCNAPMIAPVMAQMIKPNPNIIYANIEKLLLCAMLGLSEPIKPINNNILSQQEKIRRLPIMAKKLTPTHPNHKPQPVPNGSVILFVVNILSPDFSIIVPRKCHGSTLSSTKISSAASPKLV
jgi:hypothetical protein